MKNNKLFALFIAVLLGALVLTACGGQAQEVAPTAAAAVEEAVEEAAAEVEEAAAEAEEAVEEVMEEPT